MNEKILIVDDEETCREIFGQILKFAGYQTEKAEGARQAQDVMSSFNPDLVILDMAMQGISGVELAHRLRENPAYKNLPILFITGFGETSEQNKATQLPFSRLSFKPIGSTKLVQEVQSLLKEAKQTKSGVDSDESCPTEENLYTLLDFWLHELRSPLSTIVGFLELLQDEQTGRLNEKQKKYVDHIARSAHLLNRFIREIILYAKIENQEIQCHPVRKTSEQAFFEYFVEQMGPLKELGIEVCLPDRKNDLVLEIDEVLTKQLFEELIAYLVHIGPKTVSIETQFADGWYLHFSYSGSEKTLPPSALLHARNMADIFSRHDKRGCMKLLLMHRLMKIQGGKFWWTERECSQISFLFPIIEKPKTEG